MQINNLLSVNGFKIKNKNKLIDVFPDFIFGNLKVNNIEYEDCCLELKVTNNFNKKLLDRHTEQCINYCLISKKPTILFYLIHDEKTKIYQYKQSQGLFNKIKLVRFIGYFTEILDLFIINLSDLKNMIC